MKETITLLLIAISVIIGIYFGNCEGILCPPY